MTVRISNGQYLTVLDPIPLDNIGWYARVLSQRDYSTQIALVERFTEIGFTKEESGIGGGRIVIDAEDRIWSDPLPLGETDGIADQEALWQFIEDGIVRFEMLAEDLVEKVIPGDDQLREITLTGRGTGFVLEWAKVLPAGMPAPTSMSRSFTAHPMTVWATLFGEAQAAGFLPFVSLTFDGTYDSSATAWGAAQTVTVQAGTSLLDLLTQYCEANGYAWKMLPGFRLQVLKDPGQLISSTVVFTASKDQDEHERKETRRELANVVYAANGENSLAVSEDGPSQTKWRKRAVWLSAGGSSDSSAVSSVANAHLTLHKDPAKSRAIKVAPYGKGKRVFVDFDVSDEIGIEEVAENGPTPMRVKAITVKTGTDGYPEVELTMQSRMEARMIRLQKMLDKLGGSQQGEGSAPIPVSETLQATKLSDLSDIATAGVLSGDVLTFSGGMWVDATPNLNFLSDVDTVTVPPTNGQALVYDNATGQWKPGSVSGGGSGSVTPPSIRATSSNANSSYNSTATVVVPASAVAGDLLVIAVLGDWQTSSTPSGWTLQSSANGSYTNVNLFSKTAVAGDAGSTVSFTMGGSGGWHALCAAVQNATVVKNKATQQWALTNTGTLSSAMSGIDPVNDLVLMFGEGRVASSTSVAFNTGTLVTAGATSPYASGVINKVTGLTSVAPTITTTGSQGVAMALIAVGPATSTANLSQFDAPYPGTAVSLSSDTEQTKGNKFWCTGNATISSATVYVNAVAGKTYNLRLFELASNGTTIAAQIGSTVVVASPGTAANTPISTGAVSWQVTAGKWYIVTLTTSDGSSWGAYYAGQGAMSPYLICPPNVTTYMKVANTSPGVGTVLSAVPSFSLMTTIVAVPR